MNKNKICAVCGDDCKNNVKLKWKRKKDNKTFNICCLWAEGGRVNEKSVDNFGYCTEAIATTETTTTEQKIINRNAHFRGYAKSNNRRY